MIAKYLLFPILLGGLCSVLKSSHAQAQIPSSHCFLENKGQITDQYGNPREDIDFRIGGSGLNVFAGSAQLHYQWITSAPTRPDEFDAYRMDMTLVGANPQAKVVAEQLQPYTERYYRSELSLQGAAVRSYRKIIYENVYPHIDWVLYIQGGQVEYDFLVHPGGKTSDIKMRYGGATKLSIDQSGRLTAVTPMGEVTENAPVSFQENGTKVSSSFVLQNDVLGFKTAEYEGTLTIDPTLSWSTYYGGTNAETIHANCITGDNYNNRYFTGYTNSTANIATTGSFQATISAGTDAFLVKFNGSGVRQWATYYGGSSTDQGWATVCDTSGNIYLAGSTSSSGLSTPGSFQASSGGTQEAFLVKFDTSGARLWATYYGGASSDQAVALSCDAVGNIIIAGITNSTAGLATTGAFKTTNSGSGDAFVAKFNSAGARQWSTYYGGTDMEQLQAVCTDDSNNVYITGYTMSTTNISSIGSHQSTLSAGEDGFLVKFDSSGNRQWATYYGSAGYDEPNSVKCDKAGNVYIVGTTNSTSNIATTGSFQAAYGGGLGDGFLVKFNKVGTRQWGTYYGGTINDVGWGLAVSSLGKLYITGSTNSTSGIASLGTFQDTMAGVQDAYLAKFDTSGSRIWGTYFGGELSDAGYGVFYNSYSRVILGGSTKSYTGIASSGSHQTIFGGGTNDGLIVDFNDCILSTPSSISGNDTVCRKVSYTYSVPAVPGATSYTWSVPSGWSGTSTTNSITLTTGTLSDTIKVAANFTCGTSAFIFKAITISALPTLSPAGTVAICSGDSTTLVSSAGTTYKWLQNGVVIPGATTSTFKAFSSDIYAVVVTNAYGCSDTSDIDTVIAHPIPVPVITVSGTVLNTGTYTSYQWNHNGTPIVGATTNSYSVTVTTGNYTVSVTDSNGCTGTSLPFDAATLGIYNSNGKNRIVTIYPNPGTDVLNIISAEQVDIVLSSMEGRVVGQYKKAKSIDVSNLASGIYVLRLSDRNGAFVGTAKITIQNNR